MAKLTAIEAMMIYDRTHAEYQQARKATQAAFINGPLWEYEAKRTAQAAISSKLNAAYFQFKEAAGFDEF